MELLRLFAEKVKGLKLSITDKGAIKQTERNALKSELLEAFIKDLPSELVVGRAKEGIILEIPNTIEGSLPLILDIKFKNTDFDTATPVNDFMVAQKDKIVKAKEKADKTARALAKRKAQQEKDKD